MTLIKAGVIFIIGVVLFFTLNPLGIVGAGERGVRLRFGAVVGVVDEGLYFRIPLVESVKKMNVRVQKEQVKADAASKDLQTATTEVALNFRLDATKVTNVYQELGVDYKDTVVSPALQEAVKATTANYTAEELVTKRESVSQQTAVLLRDRLQGRGIIVEGFNVVNFDFSEEFNKAVEAKGKAEQDALASKNKLEQVKYEAQQDIEKAKGRAEAIRIESEALLNNPQLIELRKVEKWDGKLPQVTGESSPLINIK